MQSTQHIDKVLNGIFLPSEISCMYKVANTLLKLGFILLSYILMDSSFLQLLTKCVVVCIFSKGSQQITVNLMIII